MLKELPGIVFSIFAAFIAIFISEMGIIKNVLHLNSLVIAIILGFSIANLIKLPDILKPGITFTLKKILKLAIILIGFKISLGEIYTLGFKGLFVILLSLTICFYFTLWMANKVGIERKLAILLASGTSICGASAIIATGSIIKSDENDSALSVAIISVIGTIFMILYPIAFHTFRMNEVIYSIWVGSSIHEVAQVVAAGFSINEQVGSFSSMVKMSRVTFIVPVTLFLLLGELRQVKDEKKNLNMKEIAIPWFVVGFILMIIFNSLNILPQDFKALIVGFDNLLLTAAMFCVGAEINFSKVKNAGLKPFYLCLASSMVISAVSLITTIFIFS